MSWLRESELPAANKIFVDREAPQKIFEEAAFAIPRQRAIVRVFYGVGGQGKTALCRELIRKTGPAGDPSYAFLRRALLDLHGKVKTEPDLLLVWIRNAFAEADISFACFDFALALMWEGQRGEQPFPTLTNPWLGRTTGAAKGAVDEGAKEASDWLSDDDAKELLGDLVAEIPGVGFLLKRLSHWAIDKGKKAYLLRTRQPLQKLFRDGELLPAYEISKLLPWMLAQDLNHYLEQHPDNRFVLFVDEYERVFDQGGAGAAWRENEFDRHMRAVVENADGLLAVFFSRERLPWEASSNWRAELKDSQYLLGGLGDKDAEQFLKAVPIEDANVRKAIIDGARETPASDAPVYPLMLDLQVEHWRNLFARGEAEPRRFTVEAETFEDRRVMLIERVLRDYGDPLQATVERLSVVQRFDRDAFACIVETFRTAVPLDLFDRIASLSFVTKTTDGFLVLHNVVREAICKQLDEEKRRTSIDALLAHFAERANVASHFELSEDKIAALFEATYLRRLKGVDGYVEWVSQFAEPLYHGVHYAASARLWKEALDFLEPVIGAENLTIAECYNNFACSLEGQGDPRIAEPWNRKALATAERIVGSNHVTTAKYYSNVASNLSAQGRFVEAEPFYRIALEIRERELGSEHIETASSYNGLASNLDDLGRFREAEPIYRKALGIRKRLLGEENADTATSYNNLGYNLNAQGLYEEADPWYRKALDIRIRVLGPNHPTTALSYNNVAYNLHVQGLFAEAEPLYRKAVEINEYRHGMRHPATARSYNSLAGNLYAQGRVEQAESLLQKAHEIADLALGGDHPLTTLIKKNLSVMQGRPKA